MRTRGLARYFTAAIGKRIKVEAEEIRDPIYAAEGLSAGVLKCARFDYDFAVDGGVAGAINLRGGTIPAGVLVLAGLLNIETDVASGGDAADAMLGINSAVDVVADTGTNAAPWDGTGLKAIVPDLTPAKAILTTAVKPVVLTIQDANLTGGKFSLFLLYLKIS
jgi:hypothetical protein